MNKHLAQYFDSPDASVEVRQFNSKVFYVITEGAGMGDNIRRVPITGNDTVLDALSAVNGLSQLSSTKVWVARPAPGGFGCEQILPVDYDAITHGGSTATNYQIMPGDRVFVAGDNLIATNNWLTKVTAPIERMLRRHLVDDLDRPKLANPRPRIQPTAVLNSGKRGQVQFVRSTLRAVPANWTCPLFPRVY